MYFFGGDYYRTSADSQLTFLSILKLYFNSQYRTQISKIIDCQVTRIGDLSFRKDLMNIKF